MTVSRFDASAHAYDRFMGRWSRLFVPSLVDAVRIARGDRVLDLAAGTGAAALVVTEAAPETRVVAVDFSAPMLRTARANAAGRRIAVAVMDGQRLACRSESFDAALCMLALMFFPDPARGAAEVRRVLRRGGRAAVCVWGSIERAPFPGILLDVLAHHAPAHRAELLSSFTLADPDRLRGALTSGGFAHVEVTPVTRHVVFEGFDDFWEPLAAGGARASQILLAMPDEQRAAACADMRARMARFDRGGRISLEVETLVGVGVKD